MHFPPPRNEEELMERANALSGLTLDAIAARQGSQVPGDLRRSKGWVGELLEKMLGATAGSLPQPDFQHLGIELKTIPVHRDGRPAESTHVCTVPLSDNLGLTWESSLVRRKLARVLWIPVECEKSIPIRERHIGTPLLWSPNPPQERILRQDWEELMEMVCLGKLDEITAQQGVSLQIRPKAANSRALCRGNDRDGQHAPVLPRGFYLRASFTRDLLQQHFLIP